MRQRAADFVRARSQRIGFGGILAIAWLAFVVVAAIVIPMIVKNPSDPGLLAGRGLFKVSGHPLGGDAAGNDMLTTRGEVSTVEGELVCVSTSRIVVRAATETASGNSSPRPRGLRMRRRSSPPGGSRTRTRRRHSWPATCCCSHIRMAPRRGGPR